MTATYSVELAHYETGQQVQLWSFNDNGHFAAAADNGDVRPPACSPTPSAGAALTSRRCSGGTTSCQAFNPDPAVGAGKAGGNITGIPGSPTNQYVNFAQFGRCLDVTGQQVGRPPHRLPLQAGTGQHEADLEPGLDLDRRSGTGQLNTCRAPDALLPDRAGHRRRSWCASLLEQPHGPAVGGHPVTGSPSTSYNLVSQSRRSTCLSISPTDLSTYGSSTIVLEPCDGSTSSAGTRRRLCRRPG